MRRREFIGAVATGVGALGLAPHWALAQDVLSQADFQEMLKSRFYFSNAGGTAHGQVKLTSVQQQASTESLNQFNLQFRGSRGVSLPEGLYGVENWNGHPYFEVHIQPVGVDRRGREIYLASFAHLQ